MASDLSRCPHSQSHPHSVEMHSIEQEPLRDFSPLPARHNAASSAAAEHSRERPQLGLSLTPATMLSFLDLFRLLCDFLVRELAIDGGSVPLRRNYQAGFGLRQ